MSDTSIQPNGRVNQPDTKAVRQFFEILRDPATDDFLQPIVTFGNPGGPYTFFDHSGDLDRLVERVEAQAAQGRNVYAGTGLLEKYPPQGKRGSAEDVVAVRGLYADIDIRGPAHKGDNLPPNVNEAMNILLQFRLSPTMIVDSGHGLQPWWLFRESLTFEDDAERKQFENLTKDFHYTLAEIAREGGGWKLDNVSDLARILRVPGTINHKPECAPVPVTLLNIDETARYAPADFEPYLREMPQANGSYAPSLDIAAILDGVPQGQRDNKLHSYACSLESRKYMLEEAVVLIRTAAENAKPPFDPNEAEDKVRRVFGKYRAVDPEPPSINGNAPTGHSTNGEVLPGPDHAPYVGVVEELIDRLVAAERDRLCYSRSAWQRYMAGVWKTLEPDEGDHLPYNMVREVSKKPGGPKYSWHLVKEVQNGARVELAKPVGIWDQDPHKLAFTNITLNLKTFEPEPHSPAHYITAGVPYDYDPNATGPNWDRYMTYLREHPEVGPEVVDFLIEYLGYCLTADTSAEIMLFLVGKRGSGKSTFIEGAEAMLGRDLVMAQSVAGLQERFGRAGIVGKRMILSKELSALKLLETDIISNIVSGERIRIEHKGLDGYDYTPVAKIIQAANNLPRVPNTEAGIYRRLQVVRFPNLEVTPDTAIKEGIKAEGPHILNTALRGLKRLRDNDGFTIPARVRAASAAWHDDNNIVQMFFDECVEEGNKMIRVARLHTLYKRWCEQHNYKPVALNLFGQQARSVPFYQVHHTNPKNVSKLRDIDLTEEGHAVNESSYKEAINWADI